MNPLADRVAAMAALMLADPEAAVEAVKQVKILSRPCIFATGHRCRYRLTNGSSVRILPNEGRGDHPEDGLFYWQMDGESWDEFVARVDAGWAAAGWKLV